jgi:hypothetical protein
VNGQTDRQTDFDRVVLGCDVTWFCEWVPPFRRNATKMEAVRWRKTSVPSVGKTAWTHDSRTQRSIYPRPWESEI